MKVEKLLFDSIHFCMPNDKWLCPSWLEIRASDYITKEQQRAKASEKRNPTKLNQVFSWIQNILLLIFCPWFMNVRILLWSLIPLIRSISNSRSLKSWNPGILESWISRVLEIWNLGFLESWSHEVMEHWSHRIIESWAPKY